MLEDRFDERERTQIAYTLETVIGDCVKAIHAIKLDEVGQRLYNKMFKLWR